MYVEIRTRTVRVRYILGNSPQDICAYSDLMRSNRWMLPPTHKYSASVGLVGGWTQWGRWMCPTSRLDTTLNDGYLGLVIDEGRSEVR